LAVKATDLVTHPHRRVPVLAALGVSVAVPTLVLASLIPTLKAPFWFNEQERAYYISYGANWWQALHTDAAPSPAGWYFLERFTGQLFGSREITLRLPTAMWLLVSCVLLLLIARRWMPLPAALGVALIGGLNGGLLGFSVQIEPFLADTGSILVLLLLHDIAVTQPRTKRGGRLASLCYAGIAVATIFGLATILVAGPLLAADVVATARGKAGYRQLVGAVAAGMIGLVGLAFFTIRQNALTKISYWDASFLPRTGLAQQIHFVWNGLGSFVVGGLTTGYNAAGPALIRPRGANALAAAWGLLLVIGIIRAARSRGGRSLLVAIGGSLSLTLVASYLRYWPFGLNETTLFEVPLLVLLSGFGACQLAQWIRDLEETARRHHDIAVRVAALGVTAATLLCFLAGIADAAAYEGAAYQQLVSGQPQPKYGDEVRLAVGIARSEAEPDAAVLVAGLMAVPGWTYYLWDYTGRATQTGLDIPPQRVLLTQGDGSPVITEFLDRVQPSELFVYIPNGTTGGQFEADLERAAAAGYCTPAGSVSLPTSGLLDVVKKGTSCSGGGS
jgi:hypothetical protein